MSVDDFDDNLEKDPTDAIEEDVIADDEDDEDADNGHTDEEGSDESGRDGRIQEGTEETSERKIGRGEKAVLRAKEEARKAREDAAAVRRDLEAFKSEKQQQANQYAEEQRRQKYEYMSPEERTQHEMKDRLDSYDQRFRDLEFRSWESNDRAAFSQLVHRDKTAARLAPQIEREISELRSRGNTVDRKTLYTYKVGEEVLRKREQAESKEKKAGSSKIQKQSTKPGNSQSNVSSGRREKTYRDRLEGVTF